MIFVTIGTQKYKFNRIVKYLKNIENEEIIFQNGYTKVKEMKNVKSFNFLTSDEMRQNIEEANYVITHGGITIFEMLNQNKKIIAIPRTKKNKEHINDHQFELCNYLEEEGYILVAKTEKEFINKLNEIKKFKPKKYISNEDEFLKNLNAMIDEMLTNL